MRTILLLAEKPDQAKKYANVLGTPKKTDTGWDVYSEQLSAQVLVRPAVGHLVERSNPWTNFENWESVDRLPMFPDHFDFEIKKNTKKNFNAIKNAIKTVDSIMIGTDPDREGEAIAYYILNKIPGSLKKVSYRLWANSLTQKGLDMAFRNLRRPEETVNYYHEAEARGEADWLVGFNLSPFTTLMMRDHELIPEKSKGMTVGRVQTPIVSLIVKNNEEIENFVSKPFWQLRLFDQTNQVAFSHEAKFETEAEAVEALELLSDRTMITQVSSEKKSKTAPKLYNLTDIQAEMSKLYKFDADRTKSIIQSLYQKGYMSYPRTNSNLITTNEFDYLVEHIDDYQAAIGKTIETPNRSPRKSFVNNKKVVEHYAIIPTEIIPNMEELEKEERLIYQMVTFRTLLMFAPDYEYTSTSITLDNNGQEFKTTGSVTLSKGWQVYLPSQSKEQVLPSYQEGQEIAVERQLKEDATKPPQRITENSLLKKWLPKYSLGTPATRDAMIKSVQDKGYITKDKKSGQLFPTERGILLIHYLDKLNIAYTNPETTGKWETALAKIGEGKMKKEDFVAKVRLAITKQIERGKEIG